MIFISYRRADTGAWVRALVSSLRQAFGTPRIFLDVDNIPPGEKFPDALRVALESTRVLIVPIGPKWLGSEDEFFRRRLDDTQDWVRREIIYALEKDIIIVPLLFGDTVLPETEALPEALQGMLNHNAYEIREAYWEDDVQGLIEALEDRGLKRGRRAVQYPRPGDYPPILSNLEIGVVLNDLDGWTIESSPVRGQEPRMGTELVRSFEFESFRDAVAFMQSVLPFIEEIDHHPRWENIYSTVFVALCTWDAGFWPTEIDVKLAEHFDEQYRNAPGAKPAQAPSP